MLNSVITPPDATTLACAFDPVPVAPRVAIPTANPDPVDTVAAAS